MIGDMIPEIMAVMQMFTLYTIVLVVFAPLVYKFIDLLLLCCVNACVYFVIAYINPGYIKAGNLVVSNLYVKIPIDIAAHWFPLVLMYVIYGSFYKNNLQPKLTALLLYGIYVLVVNCKTVYEINGVWMLLIGGAAGLLLETALLTY